MDNYISLIFHFPLGPILSTRLFKHPESKHDVEVDEIYKEGSLVLQGKLRTLYLLDWKPEFKKAVMPVFSELYERVADGREIRRVIRTCGKPVYREQLSKELSNMANSEMWQAGQAASSLRPKEPEQGTG